MLEPFNFVAKYLPGSTMTYSADVLSRWEMREKMPVSEFLAQTQDLDVFEKLDADLRPDRQTESEESFLLRHQKNVDTVKRITESRDFSEEDLYAYFAHSHHIPRRLREAVNAIQNPVEDSNNDLEFWKENFAYNVRLPEPKAASVRMVIQEKPRVPAGEVDDPEYNRAVDYFKQALPSSDVTNLTRDGMRWMREDAACIAESKPARDILLNPTEELVPQAFARSSREYGDFAGEVNYIYHHTLSTEGEIPTEPLFHSYKEVKAALNYARLSDEIAGQYKFFAEVQARNTTIKTIVDILEGRLDVNDGRVDDLKRLDDLARVLINDLPSLCVFKKLLFKLKLPRKQEYSYCLLVLPELDASRFCLRIHAG
ncbi:MAG: hypothetical protein AAFU85_32415, partial [Planctomycetota bacterium]